MKNAFLPILILFGGALASCSPQPAPQSLRPPPLQPAPVAPVRSSALPPPGGVVLQNGVGVPGSVPGSVPAAPGPYTPPGAGAANGGDLQAIPQLPGASSGNAALSGNVSVGPDIEFGRNAVLGAWNLSAQGDICALNLSLTSWSGGFRASTRKCSVSELISIGAWNQNGKQLTLLDAKGGLVARLVASGANRFDGTTEASGKAISVYR